jgi:hypothetical protein
MSAKQSPPFLDDDERDFVESFEAALDSGALRPSVLEVRAKASAEWKAMVERPLRGKPLPCDCKSGT